MSVIMAIFSAFAPPQDKPDTGSGNSGQIQQEVKISLDAAIDIAVADAGVARADAKFTEAKLDSDDLVAHYDIEFIAGANEYDYEIAVTDGSILKKEVEPADPSNPSKPQPDVSGYISIDEAKAIALKKVSLDASKVTFKKAELDADDRTPHYDIEFVSGGYEYEFEIDAKSGKILEFDRERVDKKPSVDTSKFISVEEAKAAALKRASLDASKVTFTKAELDIDDRTPHYDIEFVSGGYETSTASLTIQSPPTPRSMSPRTPRRKPHSTMRVSPRLRSRSSKPSLTPTRSPRTTMLNSNAADSSMSTR